VTILTRLLEPGAPEPVLEAARSLRFRAMLLIYLALEQDHFTEYDAHYFPGAEVRITRLSEPKNYSARSEPAGRTMLCAELPCQPEDGVWGLSDRALGELVREDLGRAGLPVTAPVRAVAVRRLPHAYPLYPRGYEAAFDRIDDWLETLPALLSFGRQGLYAHDNTHHALYMAQAAARSLRDDGSFDAEAWQQERRIFETHVVED
jgi:protoporphyrinogen oxidase